MSSTAKPPGIHTLAPPQPAAGVDAQLRLVAVRGATFHRCLGTNDVLVVGRGEDSDVRVSCDLASRSHARLYGKPPAIEDLGSSNGTYLNGQRLEARSRVPLAAGMVVRIGSVTMLVEAVLEGEVAISHGSAAPSDPVMRAVVDTVRAAARSSLPVLLLGETGVGKERLAAIIHNGSPRVGRRFLHLNCAALPDSLLEAELFGHERGAFTGAVAAKVGLLEAASGGTLFLDEIGEMSLTGQAKLLRFLESGEVQRLGSVTTSILDTRVVAATNRNLTTQISTGSFRADLYYRLAGVIVHVPPLRRRPLDIKPLALTFLREAALVEGRNPPTLTEAAWATLHARSWPGNVRELRTAIRRAVAMNASETLDDIDVAEIDEAEDSSTRSAASRFGTSELSTRPSLPILEAREPSSGPLSSLPGSVASLERAQIEAALDTCGGNQSRAATMLGISRRMLLTRLDKYRIVRPRKSTI